MKKGKILIVDDNRNVLNALRIFLESSFEEVLLLSSPNSLVSTVREKAPDVVLLDMNFSAGINSGNEGLYWLAEIRKLDPELPVVLFTAYADIALAVRALKDGATDFVVKPWDNTKLLATLQSALELRLSRREVKRLRERQSTLNRELNRDEEVCWGNSYAMQEMLEMINKVAATDANVLITGENGTGKEVIAKKIHNLSRRSGEPLVSVDMGAVTESLFESELFGHTKGSFTDAKADRAGKFEAADGGTLFLDEIGNLSYPLQAKLLTALQSRRIVRVGSNTPIPVDIRLVSATNKDLHRMVREGLFREDLLYRINTIHLDIPPLRQRMEDIVPLAEMFLAKYAAKYNKPASSFSREVKKLLSTYSWPGNIRELQHTVEKAVILSGGKVIDTDILLLDTRRRTIADPGSTLKEIEREVIREAIERHGGNLSAVAGQLGITRQALYNKIKRFEL